MKKQLLSTMLTISIAGVTVAAQAQMSPTSTPYQSDQSSETTSQTTTSPSGNMMRTTTQTTSQTTAQSSSNIPLTGAAQVTQVSTSGEVIIGPDAASSTLPPFTVGMGTTTINVLNPGPEPVTFSVPALNISYDVAANSERLVQLDRTQTASLTPGQQVAYVINDANGNQVASSTLTNNQEIASMIDTNTEVATTEETTTTTTTTSTEYHPPTKRATVRGFW